MDATSATPCTEHAKGDESQDVTVVSPSRLCDLPDEILIHILSFLKTKEAARTCILSKRWVDLWTSLPDLRFDGREIGNVSFMEDPFTTLSLIHGISPKTIEYIDRAFRLRDPQYTIRTFSLEQISVLEDVSCRRIIACINAAIRCKVQNLSLGIYNFCFSFVLPDSIFRCSTLVKLELGLSGLGTLSLPSSVQLSSLKVLKLSGVIFADDESVRKLFSCPLLEVLKIRRCNFIDITKLEISSPKLRVLSIDERSGSNGYRAMINGTNLESFHYGGDFVNEYVMVGKCAKLVKAKFTVYHQRNRRNRAAEHGYKLLASVSGTRNLILRYEFIEAITCGRNSNVRINLLPVFGNLIHLEVVEMVYIHLHSLFAMLRKFPHLQSLELLLRRGDDGEDHEAEGEGDELGDAPSCFSTHLKEIIIKEFCGIDNEFNTVGILLKNAVVLENLFIECTEELSTCNIEKLQLLPRGSSNCRISIVRLFF